MVDFPLANILDFFMEVSPFNTLGKETLIHIVSQTQISFFPKGEVIIRMGSAPRGFLYIIQAGMARISIADEKGDEILIDIRGPGDSFGAISLFQGKRSQFNVTADEDLIVFFVPEKELIPLLDSNKAFKLYFDASLTRNFQAVRKAADDQVSLYTPANQLNLEMFLTGKRVADLMSTDVLTCLTRSTVQEVAEKMTALRVGSIVVVDEAGEPLGIITDLDLRGKILANNRSLQTEASEIMSHPVHTISPQAYAFDVLLNMSRYGIAHLIVVENGHLVGLVSEHDFQIEIGSSPIGIIGDIRKAKTLKTLIQLRPKIDNILDMALRRSETVRPMVALIAELNDRVTYQITELVGRELEREGCGVAPLPYCWLAMGSEGRQEQTLFTDQDNALIYDDVSPDESHEKVKQWFTSFSKRVVDVLADFGIPRCSGGMMASNPQWCQSITDWEDMFLTWISDPTPWNMRMATVFFDFRAITEDCPNAVQLRDLLNKACGKSRHFLRFFAKDALRNRPPIGFFKKFVVEKSGEHKNELNLKLNGLAPVVDTVRVLALELGINATNTMERLEAIADHNVIEREFCSEITEAYDFINFVRISHHLKARSEGHLMHNFVDPAILNNIQRKMLKESFSIISRLQHFLETRYDTQYIMEG